MSELREWHCDRCGWTGTSPVETVAMFHYCHPRLRRRRTRWRLPEWGDADEDSESAQQLLWE